MKSRKRPHRSGAICRVRWSGAASGARPRHVRVRVVSRFSALQKTGKNIEMAANASVFRFRIGVVRPCGSCPAPARFLPGSCPAAGSCPAPARLLPGSCPVPAQRPVPARFLHGSRARFLPGSCPTAGQEPPRSGGSCAGAGQQPPHHSWVLHHPCADASYHPFLTAKIFAAGAPPGGGLAAHRCRQLSPKGPLGELGDLRADDRSAAREDRRPGR